MSSKQGWVSLALNPTTVRTSLAVAVVAGTLLNAINQGPQVWRGQPVDWLRFWLTYAVPYVVSSIGAVAARRQS